MTLYRNRVRTVEATQVDLNQDAIPDKYIYVAGNYYYDIEGDMRFIEHGDWIVKESNEILILSDARFKLEYEEVPK